MCTQLMGNKYKAMHQTESCLYTAERSTPRHARCAAVLRTSVHGLARHAAAANMPPVPYRLAAAKQPKHSRRSRLTIADKTLSIQQPSFSAQLVRRNLDAPNRDTYLAAGRCMARMIQQLARVSLHRRTRCRQLLVRVAAAGRRGPRRRLRCRALVSCRRGRNSHSRGNSGPSAVRRHRVSLICSADCVQV